MQDASQAGEPIPGRYACTCGDVCLRDREVKLEQSTIPRKATASWRAALLRSCSYPLSMPSAAQSERQVLWNLRESFVVVRESAVQPPFAQQLHRHRAPTEPEQHVCVVDAAELFRTSDLQVVEK